MTIPVSDNPILVFGATGRVGGQIIRQLLERGIHVTGAVRDPIKAQDKLPVSDQKLQLVTADLSDSQSVYKAAKETNARRVFIYAMVGGMSDTIDALHRAGVQHVVLLSAFSVQPKFLQENNFSARLHAEAEDSILKYHRSEHMSYTFIRGGAFASNVFVFWRHAIQSGSVSLYEPDSTVNSMVAEEDLAAIAVRALTTHELDNQAVPARGPTMVTQRQQFEIISRVLNKPITVNSITEQQYRQQLEHVMPSIVADAVIGFFRDRRQEKEGTLEDTIRALGRKPMDFASYMEKHKHEIQA